MDINGFKVEILTEDECRYIRCNKQTLPAYHIVSMVKLAHSVKNIYEIDNKELILKESLFNMVVKFEDLEKLYKLIKTI